MDWVFLQSPHERRTGWLVCAGSRPRWFESVPSELPSGHDPAPLPQSSARSWSITSVFLSRVSQRLGGLGWKPAESGFWQWWGGLGACWRHSTHGCGRGTASTAQSLFHPSLLCAKKGWQERLAVMWVEIDFMESHGHGKHGAVSYLPSNFGNLDGCRAWGCWWQRHRQVGLGKQSSSPWVYWRCLRLGLCNWTGRWMRNVKMGGFWSE